MGNTGRGFAQVLKAKRRRINVDDYATNPQEWRTTARRLLMGARLLWDPLSECLRDYAATRDGRSRKDTRRLEEQLEYFGGFFLLAGLAVENGLKARIVERAHAEERMLVTVADVFKLFPPKHHDLVALADSAKVTLSPAEGRLLQRLSMFVQWAGRYSIPTPKRVADAATFRRETRPRDWQEIEAFIRRLNS
jgi:hypothetical protein